MVNKRAKKEFKEALALIVSAARRVAAAEEKLLKAEKPKRLKAQKDGGTR